MTLDTRWKNPPSSDPRALYLWAQDLVRDLRKAGVGSTQSLAADDIAFAATKRVLGRNTAGAGDGEEVSLTQLLDWIGSAAQGDILYRGASSWARLPAGTSGQVLQTQGASANPVWADSAGGSVWEQIADSGNLGTVSQVEQTFTAGRYAKVLVVASDLTIGGTLPSIVISLRNSSSAIVTLTGQAVNGFRTYSAEFALGLVQSTHVYFGVMDGAVGSTADTSGPYRSAGSIATAADRSRVAMSNGNITGGRVMSYGLLAAP